MRGSGRRGGVGVQRLDAEVVEEVADHPEPVQWLENSLSPPRVHLGGRDAAAGGGQVAVEGVVEQRVQGVQGGDLLREGQDVFDALQRTEAVEVPAGGGAKFCRVAVANYDEALAAVAKPQVLLPAVVEPAEALPDLGRFRAGATGRPLARLLLPQDQGHIGELPGSTSGQSKRRCPLPTSWASQGKAVRSRCKYSPFTPGSKVPRTLAPLDFKKFIQRKKFRVHADEPGEFPPAFAEEVPRGAVAHRVVGGCPQRGIG